jgi:hypothetical protein
MQLAEHAKPRLTDHDGRGTSRVQLRAVALDDTCGNDAEAHQQRIDHADQRAEVRGRTSTRPPFATEVPGDRDAELRLLDR